MLPPGWPGRRQTTPVPLASACPCAKPETSTSVFNPGVNLNKSGPHWTTIYTSKTVKLKCAHTPRSRHYSQPPPQPPPSTPPTVRTDATAPIAHAPCTYLCARWAVQSAGIFYGQTYGNHGLCLSAEHLQACERSMIPKC